ncbi:hypothetical protein [Salmonirosea aquatica]|uniref:DUF4890 domain-containing protein n=1 Tax=Salmonirosea aquatica TaxID=2654236 RepID=A0A7C9FSS9_9BACT|nr:hypothetical protein [Cytophagaceae bacterium SJW1-29]
MKKSLIAAAFVFLLSAGSFAQGYGKYDTGRRDYPNSNRNEARLPANDRQEAQMLNDLQREARTRIADGIARGTLTSREAIRLLNEYDRIDAKERRYLANRDLTRRETRELSNDLQNLIKGIRYESIDSQRERDRLAQRRY